MSERSPVGCSRNFGLGLLHRQRASNCFEESSLAAACNNLGFRFVVSIHNLIHGHKYSPSASADQAEFEEGKTGKRPNNRAFSAALLEIAEQVEERVSIGELTLRFGDRAFGALLVALAIPNIAPLPPGSSTIFAVPLIIIALQLALGRKSIWLPPSATARSPSRRFGIL